MNELYWLTTLGKINTVCWIFFALGILILLVAIPCYFTYFDEDDLEIFIKSIKIGIVTMLISILGCTLIPSKEDLYLIYGAGTIVDYCKDSPKVKEIPDKAIDALNRYLDGITEDKKE